MMKIYPNYMVIDDTKLIGDIKQGDIVTEVERNDEFGTYLDKNGRELLLKTKRLKLVWSCAKCRYTYDQRGNCKCLR
ncbi:hypothetical protein [Bacillus wiedmannii]|uniref:hypothetical protein n=1 Tax=Bacillus wiedmannii TaxID=1890302 RepID=UPI000BF1CD10|nr:hypothetical protein [Bacillus wiedmannii]PEJ92761.1 hypothetical protein CN690_29270 [Bacillus wiedmannii]PEZ66422.1 hypothetical protein CN372_04965 [Bacillus anthracis]